MPKVAMLGDATSCCIIVAGLTIQQHPGGIRSDFATQECLQNHLESIQAIVSTTKYHITWWPALNIANVHSRRMLLLYEQSLLGADAFTM
jgi:hypothetical protein